MSDFDLQHQLKFVDVLDWRGFRVSGKRRHRLNFDAGERQQKRRPAIMRATSPATTQRHAFVGTELHFGRATCGTINQPAEQRRLGAAPASILAGSLVGYGAIITEARRVLRLPASSDTFCHSSSVMRE